MDKNSFYCSLKKIINNENGKVKRIIIFRKKILVVMNKVKIKQKNILLIINKCHLNNNRNDNIQEINEIKYDSDKLYKKNSNNIYNNNCIIQSQNKYFSKFNKVINVL